MPQVTIQAQAGFNSQGTQVQSSGSWFTGNLVRWRQGMLEKLGGWIRLVPDPFAGPIRRLHAWLDLENRRNLFVGTDAGLEMVVDDKRYVMVEGVTVSDPRKSTWFLDNLGEHGLALTTDGPLLIYKPPPLDLPEPPPAVEPIATAPSSSHGMFVAMPQAQVILWGTMTADDGTGVLDPLLIRWSDAGTNDVWIGAVINQAGSFRLSRGSRIMGAIQAPQTTLIFTDMDVWSMNYIGPPLVYGFTIMGTGCGLVAPHAVTSLGRNTFWQGTKGFWKFGDSGVQPMMSTVHDYIFDDIDVDDIGKCHAGSNSVGNEVTFYFCSRKEPYRRGAEEVTEPYPTVLSNEPTRYVKLTTTEPAWDSGKLGRTAWINQNIFGMPLGADLNNRVQQHERGFDDDDEPMRGVYAESGYSEIANGAQMVSVNQCQPDFKWFGVNGGVTLTLRTRGYASSQPLAFGPFSMTETTQFFNPRARGKYMALRLDWAARKGFSARLGATRLLVTAAGRRP